MIVAPEAKQKREARALIERHIRVDPYGHGPADARLAEYGTPVWALVGYYLGEAGRDPARVAADYELPLESVEAALAYFEQHREAITARLTLNRVA